MDGELQMEASFERNTEPALPRGEWWLYMLLGIALIIVGVVAIVVPAATAITLLSVDYLLGALLLIGGVLQAIYAFRRHATAGRVVLALIVSALYVIAGLILIGHPFAAILSLTLFLAAFLVVAGIFKVIAAFEMYGTAHWGWTLVGGIVSFILGVLIWAGWPATVWALGLWIGIDLLYIGWTMIAIAVVLHAVPSVGGRLAGQH